MKVEIDVHKALDEALTSYYEEDVKAQIRLIVKEHLKKWSEDNFDDIQARVKAVCMKEIDKSIEKLKDRIAEYTTEDILHCVSRGHYF